ncbi:polymorphic toxin type 44 domain-containing protein [Streptococcus pneumoniae]|nr:polymorphic toxin type 44 domain-containing protein [Streptococcus pneumoniae]
MTNNLRVANEVTDRLSSGCDHLISSLDSGELTGAAYTAGKGLFTEIIIPSIKKLQAAIDDIQLELTSYKDADAQVSGYGDLDLDQLKELKKLREEQLAIVEAQIQVRESWLNQITDLFSLNWGKAFSEKTILYNTKFQIESGIQDLDDKIEKLEFFVSQVSQYFSDSLEILGLAIKGAMQLSKIIVDSDGNYYADGLDMSWVQKMKDVKVESAKYDSSKEAKDLHKEYQKILDKLENGKELSDKEFQILESYVHHHPQIQFPQLVTEKLKAEATNRANPEKLKEKVEEIKNSNVDLNKKAEQIVKTYEDYLFYNNQEAFEEYWRKRKELTKDKDWKDVDSKIKDTIEDNLNVELKKSGMDIKEVSNNLANDILSIHEGDMKQRNYLINEGRKVWKSPGDDIMINSADLTQVSIDLTDFVNLVNTGKPLDLKSRNYNDELEFSLWSRKWEGNLRDDYLGNYLFGYVAKGYLGMEDEQIKNYAGLAQLASDKDGVKFFKNKSNGNFGDNEGDASAIQDGIDSYEENNK